MGVDGADELKDLAAGVKAGEPMFREWCGVRFRAMDHADDHAASGVVAAGGDIG